ncbi:hypothetical protein M9435_001078 [Picochlorum sp. BPE23]|nr:hypothetical protein M9435_001078 [Picochlorum sp. BPE23]
MEESPLPCTTESSKTKAFIRRATRRVSKKSVARKSPLKFEYSKNLNRNCVKEEEKSGLRRVIDEGLTDRERLNEVVKQIERVRVLPKSSAYARHKLQVLNKVKELLEARIEHGGSQNEEELSTLLTMLSLS